MNNTTSISNSQRYWLLGIAIFVVILLIRFMTTDGMRIYVVPKPGGEVAQLPSYMSDPLAQVDRIGEVAVVDYSRTIGLWLAAFLTLGVFSFIYFDNPVYKVCEAVFVGVSAAYWMVLSFWTTLIPNLFGKLFPVWIQSWAMPGLSPVYEPEWYLYFFPLVLGGMLLMRLTNSFQWMARWPLAFIIGSTAGIRLYGFLEADFMKPLESSISAPIVLDKSYFMWIDPVSYNNIIGLLCLIACLTYFFFSLEHKKGVGIVARQGIWVLMIHFGAAFGMTVMGRIALLAGRFQFLLDDWLNVMHPGGV
jgi:hypothetical protein